MDDENLASDDLPTSSIEDDFDRAVDLVRRSSSNFDQQNLLYLYGRYKIATEGVCTTSKPGLFDFKGRQKWESWKNLGEMTAQHAKTEYIRLVFEKLEFTNGDVSKKPSKSGFGQAISKFAMADGDDDNVCVSDVAVDRWLNAVKNDDLDECKLITTTDCQLITAADDQSMTALHWAADRCSSRVVKWLLFDVGLDSSVVNAKDVEGQTPLHYASSCDHLDIALMLIQCGADSSVVDSEGLSPCDVAASEDMKKILKSA